jgi:hypothetical protein
MVAPRELVVHMRLVVCFLAEYWVAHSNLAARRRLFAAIWLLSVGCAMQEIGKYHM